ncbi:MAG: Asp-tRNA(Asn)/Glu-tRNA(Gln) amidotransferase subunit GatB [Thermoplasmata archaeon]
MVAVTMIGLEVHVQLPTRSKLFCSCPNMVSEDPNSIVCPTCLGLPGSKPNVNKRAIELACIAARTLHCRLLDKTWFSRKTYFYPDLAKNFQITQYEAPIAVDGFLLLNGKRIGISRVHAEEDPASAVHDLAPEQEYSLLDYNRSGVPLIEIVTKPDMTSPAEARDFLRTMLAELRYVGVVVAGEDLKVRTDANISIQGGERVEIKNITGLRNLERALEFEERRQMKLAKARMSVKRETRSFDEEKGVTVASREKEEEEDYGYIFEPDLPVFDLKLLSSRMSFPMTATDKSLELAKRFGLEDSDVKSLLLDSKELGELLEDISQRVDPSKALRWIGSVVKAEYYKHPEIHLSSIKKEIERVIAADSEGRISDVVAKSAFKNIFETGNAGELTELEEAEGELEKMVAEILDNEPELLDEIKKQPKAMNNVVGRIIRQTKGKFDSKRVFEAVKSEVEKRS